MQKISIITINFNHEFGLERTIKSVLSQDYSAMEYIVIDGGSTDGSKQLIRNLDENANHSVNPNIEFKWVSEPDKGTYDAMNKGLAMATGVYVLFLNSGDVFASSHVLSDVFANNNDNDLIVGRQYQMRNGRKCKAHRILAEEVNKQFLISNTLPHQATFIKRDLLNRVSGYNLSYKIVADWVFWYDAIVNHSAKVCCVSSFVSIMEEEGISKDIAMCRKEMAYYLSTQQLLDLELEWQDRIEDNAKAYAYLSAQRTLIGRFLMRIAVWLGK